MKKVLLGGTISIIIGFIIGKFIFMNKDIMILSKEKDLYYFLQEGVYYDNNILENSMTNIKHKIFERKNEKIHVYVGITKDLEVAEKLINIYSNNNISISIKKKEISNNEFKNNIDQFDLLIKESNDADEILTIEEVVLANYEEVVKKEEINK